MLAEVRAEVSADGVLELESSRALRLGAAQGVGGRMAAVALVAPAARALLVPQLPPQRGVAAVIATDTSVAAVVGAEAAPAEQQVANALATTS